jgi:hypothetical protein
METKNIYSAVCNDVQLYCIEKGYREGEGVNNFIPHDAIAAFGMAKLLAGKFDRYVAVAPEGHIYGYFFEQLGIDILSVFTDYPPTRCTSEDELAVLENQRVLLIEDDVISGRTLQLVVDYIEQFKPASLALYLGHNAGIQHLGNVPREIEGDMVFVAERTLDMKNWMNLEDEFFEYFRLKGNNVLSLKAHN